jgi:hypothetical protein
MGKVSPEILEEGYLIPDSNNYLTVIIIINLKLSQG